MQVHNYSDTGDSLSIVLHAPRGNDKIILCTLYLWNSFELFNCNISLAFPVKFTNIKFETKAEEKRRDFNTYSMSIPK